MDRLIVKVDEDSIHCIHDLRIGKQKSEEYLGAAFDHYYGSQLFPPDLFGQIKDRWHLVAGNDYQEATIPAIPQIALNYTHETYGPIFKERGRKMKDKIQDEKLRVIGECQQLASGSVIVNEPEHLDDMDSLPFYDWRVEEEGFLKGL